MSPFDLLVVQPVFNVILAIYGLVPGQDFGISIILFAILFRLLALPLVKKQLRHTKLMRDIQPELKRIKAKANGDKAVEGQLMMELYRERGINVLSPLGILVVQLPIFFALYTVVQIVTSQKERIAPLAYDVIENTLAPIAAIVRDPSSFHPHLFGIDLTAHAIGSQGAVYIPLIVLAAVSAFFQYVQSKQLTPQAEPGKKLSQIFKDSSNPDKKVDQTEIATAMSQQMLVILPVFAFGVALYLPGALVLFYVVSSAVAVLQQRKILAEDVTEMEAIADAPSAKAAASAKTAKSRAKTAKVAKEVVSTSTKNGVKVTRKKRGG